MTSKFLIALSTAFLLSAYSASGAVITSTNLGAFVGDDGLTVNNVSLGPNEALVAIVGFAQKVDIADPTVSFGTSSFTGVTSDRAESGSNVHYGSWAFVFTGSGTENVTFTLDGAGSDYQYAYSLTKLSNVDTANLIVSSDSALADDEDPPAIDLGTLDADDYVLSHGYTNFGSNPDSTTTPADLSLISSAERDPSGGGSNIVLGETYGGTPGAGAYSADWAFNNGYYATASAIAFNPIPEPSATVLLLGALGAGLLFRRRRA